MHDFNPIKVHLHAVELKTGDMKRFTVLASPYLTNKFFMAQIVSVINDLTALKAMFVVRPYRQDGDELPIIYRVPQEQTKLFECGI